jgi:RNA polymerase sigma factor (TIGR02999 family)
MGAITKLLRDVEQGSPDGASVLFRAVYEELRQIAQAKMRREPAGPTLQATALVHEAWLRLGGDQQPAWQNRAHFFSAAAESMRRILIDRARARQALRRGGDQQRVDVEQMQNIPVDAADERILTIDEALARFAVVDPEKAELVKLRFFVGMKNIEAAEALGISEPTAKRWWNYARAWLQREITAGEATSQGTSPRE